MAGGELGGQQFLQGGARGAALADWMENLLDYLDYPDYLACKPPNGVGIAGKMASYKGFAGLNLLIAER